ncbi:MAG: protease inhibitor I42 family protein [Bacteroidales bacterium]|nr:protease inhibitor I42 family protein [Bacteroidales bacterium]MCF8345297.1 protease inhibitor I42 family protein [Bacteroidales bacterium]MCF8352662.1 protease inhibitor I42 family protein [Bacteroidales bacterium]MCF8377861.1 protease inhibitor I42 family protein [Bacteroidales bacterium]
MKRTGTVFALILLSFLLNSCSGPYTMKDNGKMIELSINTLFEVELEGSAETGYEWNVLSYDNMVIELVNRSKEQITEKTMQYLFEFKAVAAGETELVLIYHHPDKPSEGPAEVFKLRVISGTMGRITAE